MICENCGENEANVRYTQIINGDKKELLLCDKCSKELGIDNISFNMPINFSSFFSDFLDGFEDNTFMPNINNIKQLECKRCNTTFEEFMNKGKFGCSECYDSFQEKLNPLLKNIQGSDTHIGRVGKIDNRNKREKDKLQEENVNEGKKEENMNLREKLKNELNKAIKEERYEDAAKLRDEIKKLD